MPVMPLFNVKLLVVKLLVVVKLDGFIAALNVAVIAALTAIAVAVLAGLVEVTVGATISPTLSPVAPPPAPHPASNNTTNVNKILRIAASLLRHINVPMSVY